MPTLLAVSFFLVTNICLWSQSLSQSVTPTTRPNANPIPPMGSGPPSPSATSSTGPSIIVENFPTSQPSWIAEDYEPTNPPMTKPSSTGPPIIVENLPTSPPMTKPSSTGPPIIVDYFPTSPPMTKPSSTGPPIIVDYFPTSPPMMKPSSTGPPIIVDYFPTSPPMTKPSSTGPPIIVEYLPTSPPMTKPSLAPVSTLSYPHGVQYNKATVKRVLLAKGCTQCYSESYAKITTTDDIENLCNGAWLFVSATGPFFLGAFGTMAKVLLPSNGHVSNNVTWFYQPGHAFGFNVTYGGIYWPLNGLAGSGVGEFNYVVSSTYRKHIYSCP